MAQQTLWLVGYTPQSPSFVWAWCDSAMLIISWQSMGTKTKEFSSLRNGLLHQPKNQSNPTAPICPWTNPRASWTGGAETLELPNATRSGRKQRANASSSIHTVDVFVDRTASKWWYNDDKSDDDDDDERVPLKRLPLWKVLFLLSRDKTIHDSYFIIVIYLVINSSQPKKMP